MTPKSEAPIRLTYELDAEPTKVWRALTVPEYVSRWLGSPACSDMDDEAALDRIELRLISMKPGTHVRYSIKDNEAVSTVTFQINANDKGGTTFHIVHEQSMIAANCNFPRQRLAA